MRTDMKKVLNIHTIAEYNAMVGHQTFHPLVSVIDLSNAEAKERSGAQALNFGFYSVFYKNDKHCDIRYGRNYYDYQEGTLVFIAPGQVVSIEEDGSDYQPSGTVLLFHPDLIRVHRLDTILKTTPSFLTTCMRRCIFLKRKNKSCSSAFVRLITK